jgi:hypothetical protein
MRGLSKTTTTIETYGRKKGMPSWLRTILMIIVIMVLFGAISYGWNKMVGL